jgi:hypothetical protein
MSPPVTSEWTVPAPPRTVIRRPVRAWRLVAGVLLSLLGHLLFTGFGVAVVRNGADGAYLEGGGFVALFLVLVFEVALVVCCALPGLLLLLFGDRGFGIGLLIGWGVGVAALVLLVYLTVVAARTV